MNHPRCESSAAELFAITEVITGGVAGATMWSWLSLSRNIACTYRLQVRLHLDTCLAYIPLIGSPLAFSARRALALSNSRIFATFILLLSLGPLGANVVSEIYAFGEYGSLRGCTRYMHVTRPSLCSDTVDSSARSVARSRLTLPTLLTSGELISLSSLSSTHHLIHRFSRERSSSVIPHTC